MDKTELKKQVVELRNQILERVQEYDFRDTHDRMILNAEYQIKIGVYEVELLKAQLNAMRQKKKYQLIQAAINREEKIDVNGIDQSLDNELDIWIKKVKDGINLHKAAVACRSDLTAAKPADVKECKRLYRIIAKRLHPDICAILGEDAREYFEQAKNAYAMLNLEILQSIEIATRDLEKPENLDEMDENALCLEVELASAQLNIQREKLKKLNAQEPFCYEDIMKDPAKLNRKTAPIKEETAKQQEIYETYFKKTQDLLKDK
ncbi:MAG: hypothetical protein MJ189_00030 [Coriobacteriales bacterium]|nr:hypothetical protein [Coriobacteriales bacterium]